MGFCLPESIKIIQGLAAVNGAGAQQTSDVICVKNYDKVYAVVHHRDVTAAAVRFNVMTDTSTTAGSLAAIVNTCRIWSNLDTATSDTLVERTAAVQYTTDGVAGSKLIVFEIDPAELPAGEDCVAIQTNAVVADTNIVSVTFYCVPRYASRVATAPSGITD